MHVSAVGEKQCKFNFNGPLKYLLVKLARLLFCAGFYSNEWPVVFESLRVNGPDVALLW